MPQYEVELSDGRVVTLEADRPPGEAEVLAALGESDGGSGADILSRPPPFTSMFPSSPSSATGIPLEWTGAEAEPETAIGALKEAASQPLIPWSPMAMKTGDPGGILPTAGSPATAPEAAFYNTFIKGSYDFLNTPLGVTTMGVGAAPAWLQRLVGLGFSAEMTGAAAEMAGEASVTGDPQTMFEAAFTAAPVPFMARPTVRFGENTALTRGDVLEIGGRELLKEVNEATLAEVPAPSPTRRIGVSPAELGREATDALASPEAQSAVELAYSQKRPGNIRLPWDMEGMDAVRALRNEVSLVDPTRTAERVPGGGEAPYGKVSYMREAEAPTSTRTQEAISRETPRQEPPPEPSGTPVETPPVKPKGGPDVTEGIDFANIQRPHRVGVERGLELTEADVPALEQQRKAAYDAALEAGINNPEAFKAAFGKGVYLEGVLEGVKRKGPNYEFYLQEQSRRAPEGVPTKSPGTTEPSPATDFVSAMERWKFPEESLNPQGQLFTLPHPDAIKAIGKTAWNNAIDVAIVGIKAGRAAKEAIEAAVAYLKKTVQGFDESKIRENLSKLLELEGPRVESETARRTDAPVAQPDPVTKASAGETLADVYKIFEPVKKENPGLKVKAGNVVEAVRTGFSSKFRPLDKLAEDIASEYGTPSKKGIAGIFEQLKGASGKGEADVYRFDRDVSKRVAGAEKDFSAYMFLRRSIDRLRQDLSEIQKAQEGGDVKTLNRRRVADYTIPQLESKLALLQEQLGPKRLREFESAADAYQQHMDAALRLQVESGRMSQKVYEAIKSGNQFYAPFKVMKYLEETAKPEGTGAKIDTVADYTKAMSGIEDAGFRLGDMLGAARQNILVSRILAEKNNAMRNVSELAVFDTDGKFIKRLQDGESASTGRAPVSVLQQGKHTRYEVNPDIAEALQIYQGNGGGIISRILGFFSIPFRAGATTINLPFQVSNLMADVPRQALVSKYGVRGLADLVRYPLDLVHAFYSSMAGDLFKRDNKLFLDFLDSGVAGTTIQEHLTPKALQFDPGSVGASKKIAKTVLYSIPDFAKAIEQTSKVLGVKRAMRFHGVESGAELAKQIPEAITEIRRFSGSPDFGRQGKWTEQARLNLLYMFLNARIQGVTADLGRLLGRDGAKTAGVTWTRLGIAVGLPTAYAYMMNNDAEYADDYAKRPKQEKDNYWLIPKETFITNDNGETMRDYWRIPKRESSKWIANMVESGLAFAEQRDSETFSRFAQHMMEDISPVNIQGDTLRERMESVGSSLNPVIKAPIEVATGRDMYRHRDLVPEHMQKASPEMQYTDRTAEVFKSLADKLPDVFPEVFRSPIMLENMTRNLTAGLVTQFLPRKPVDGRKGIEQTPLLQRFQALPYTDQQAFQKEISELEREATDDYLNRHRTAQKLLDDNKGAQLDKLADEAIKRHGPDERLLKHLIDLWIAKQNGITSQERQLIALPVRQRAQYIAKQLASATPDDKTAIIQNYTAKRILTDAVAAELAPLLK